MFPIRNSIKLLILPITVWVCFFHRTVVSDSNHSAIVVEEAEIGRLNEPLEFNRSFSFVVTPSGESGRLLDYFRNKRRDPQCNPETNVYPCGALEFLGCSGRKKFYAQSIIRLTWFDAWQFCRANGMYLASVESNYEQVFMELFLRKPDPGAKEGYWLSGTDFGRKGLFFWMTNGHSFTFTNWRTGEPNNYRGQEHCVQMLATSVDSDTMKWNDLPCNLPAFTLCQEDYVRPDDNKLPDRFAIP